MEETAEKLLVGACYCLSVKDAALSVVLVSLNMHLFYTLLCNFYRFSYTISIYL